MADLGLFAILNTSLLGVYTHKLAMDVTAHNVANASTPGFSRQRPVIETTPPVPMMTLTQSSFPLQLGTGSRVKTVERIRDEFLDLQFRQANNRYNYWDTMLSNLHFVEQLFAEPGENGVRYLFDMFWSGVEEVITDPTNVAAKQELVSRASQLVENVRDLYSRLQQLRDDINSEILQRVDQINSFLHQIAELNNKIRIGMILKSPPNDLMDKRDLLVDKLSDLVDVHYEYTQDGQMNVRIGDQLVVVGGIVNEVRALSRPYGKGYYELFAGSSKLLINDGKLHALLKLRDDTLVKYMNRLDEFVLYLTDEFNVIHREGISADGSTNIRFFNEITHFLDDPRIFRIMGHRRMEGGPVKRVTGLHSVDESVIRDTPFLEDGKLIYFDGSSSFEEKDVSSGDKVDTLLGGSNNATLVGDIDLNLGDHSPSSTVSKKRLYISSDEDLRDKLLIDFRGNVLEIMGFSTKVLNFITMWDVSDARPDRGTKTYNITVHERLLDGTDNTEYLSLNVGTATDLESIANQINSQLNYIKAHVIDMGGEKVLVLVPTKELGFDTRRFDFEDPDGFFTLSSADTRPYKVLDLKPTLENVFYGSTNFDTKITTGFDIKIGSTPIHVDPTVDTLEDLARKISESKTGVLAEVTPHGRLVLRATRSYDFDLRLRRIEGPQGFFEGVGFIDTNSNPDDFNSDWSVSYTLIDVSDDYSTLRSRMSIAEFLTLDRSPIGEPMGATLQFGVSSTLMENPENIALDVGKAEKNDDWNVKSVLPTGRSNTDILKILSNSRFKRLMNDGKVSMGEYFGSVVAELGVEGEVANKMKVNNEILKRQIDGERERMKGVSLDEEMANMIKFQHAFNASARVMTAVDEMIGRVIDRLGVTGR